MYFLNDQIGWICGLYNDPNQDGSIWKTTDGGQSWNGNIIVYHTVDVHDVFFNNADLGWAVGENWGSPSGFLGKSSDGGANWTRITLPFSLNNRISKIFFVNENTGWAVGNGGYVIGTTNGGNNWSVLEEYSFAEPSWYGLYFIDDQNGWVVGSDGSIGRTTNGGHYWTITTWGTSTLYDIQFIGDNRGWIVGTNGIILITTNGGNTWNSDNSITSQSLYAVHFPVENNTVGWAVGNNGTVLVRENLTPTTTNISPDSKTVGDPGFTMIINGTNFVNGSVVRFDGNDRVTTYVNPTRLTAQILATDLNAAGTYEVRVFNSSPGGGLSNAKTFTVNNPYPSITDISPDAKTVGEPEFTMTVSGAGFVDGSQVRFDGNDKVTTYVGPTQLTAQILASDLTTTGTYYITVFNPLPRWRI